MRLFASMNTSGSGMTAERLRMDVIAGNLANANTTRSLHGHTYRRRLPIFAERSHAPLRGWAGHQFGATQSGGVQVAGIVEDPSPLRREYQPDHPDADEEGYVEFPNVDVVREMVDLMTASRAYEANATVIDVTKQMASRALELGRGV